MDENPWHGGHPARRSSSPGRKSSSAATSSRSRPWIFRHQTRTSGWLALYAATASPLASELRADLEEATLLPERVRLIPTLPQFNDKYIEPARELEERAQEVLIDVSRSERLKSAIASAAASYPVTLEDLNWGLPVEVDDAMLDTFDAQVIDLVDVTPVGMTT